MPTLTFTNGNDSYTVTGAGDYELHFLAGADTLTVDGGTTTTAYMGDDNDVASLKTRLATVYGENGADRFGIWAADALVRGGADNDVFNLRGGSGQSLYGDTGDDRFNFYFGGLDIIIAGGDGNDAFYGNGYVISGNIYGGDGNDLFLVSTAAVRCGFAAVSETTPTAPMRSTRRLSSRKRARVSTPSRSRSESATRCPRTSNGSSSATMREAPPRPRRSPAIPSTT